MVGVPPQRGPMLVLGFLPIDSSILAGMHLEIHSSNKRNLAVEGLLPSLLVCADADVPSINLPLFDFFTFFPIFSTRQSVLPLANNFSL